MKMRIEIEVEIPDDTVRANEDGFGAPATTVSNLMLRVLSTNAILNGLFRVTDETVVKTTIPQISAIGNAYGKGS